MLNKVQLIGRLGKDPELRHTQNDTAVCSFTVATTTKYKDKDGEWVENTEWHNIEAWAGLAEVCGKYLTKGKQVYVEGSIKTDKWQDNDGNNRYTTKVKASEMKMLGSKSDDQQGFTSTPKSNETNQDDDLPF